MSIQSTYYPENDHPELRVLAKHRAGKTLTEADRMILRRTDSIRQDFRYINIGSTGYAMNFGCTGSTFLPFQNQTRCEYCHTYHTADVRCTSCGAPK